jgi:hypothetical protein
MLQGWSFESTRARPRTGQTDVKLLRRTKGWKQAERTGGSRDLFTRSSKPESCSVGFSTSLLYLTFSVPLVLM